jgi:hypothetical protein
MTKSTRARYTLEFKDEAVRLVAGGEREERREVGGTGYSQLLEANARPCSEMALTAGTPNVSTLPVTVLRRKLGDQRHDGRNTRSQIYHHFLLDTESSAYKRIYTTT